MPQVNTMCVNGGAKKEASLMAAQGLLPGREQTGFLSSACFILIILAALIISSFWKPKALIVEMKVIGPDLEVSLAP